MVLVPFWKEGIIKYLHFPYYVHSITQKVNYVHSKKYRKTTYIFIQIVNRHITTYIV
nr:MAG TPA: hypothetical protein [Bacteriophage sp.]